MEVKDPKRNHQADLEREESGEPRAEGHQGSGGGSQRSGQRGRTE